MIYQTLPAVDFMAEVRISINRDFPELNPRHGSQSIWFAFNNISCTVLFNFYVSK